MVVQGEAFKDMIIYDMIDISNFSLWFVNILSISKYIDCFSH